MYYALQSLQEKKKNKKSKMLILIYFTRHSELNQA